MKTYIQSPRTENENHLFDIGYRVSRNENDTYFAHTPDRMYLYSGPDLNAAWQACQYHANPPGQEINVDVLWNYLAYQYALRRGAEKPNDRDRLQVKSNVKVWFEQQQHTGQEE